MHLMINRYNKIVYDDNGSYSDNSWEMHDWAYDTMVIPLTLDEDYIYVGAPHTFTARYFLVSVANDVSASLDIEYYYGQDNWRSLKNIEDGTRSGAVPFAKSGFIAWDLPNDWIKTQVNSLPELPHDVSSADGRGYYWVRIKSSVTLKSTTALRWLGLIWTDESFLLQRWAEVLDSRYLPTGQTDWYETIEMSTYDVGKDLNIKNIVDYELQAKDISELADLTTLKTLVNILTPFRSSKELMDMRKEFKEHYEKLLGVRLKGIDVNQDEKITSNESEPMSNTVIRRF